MATILDTQLSRALRVTPNASQTRSKAPGNVGPIFGSRDARDFPLFATGGEGAYLYDDRGRKYLDCCGANAAIPLGYGFQPVMDAVAFAASKGSLLSLPSIREAEVTEQFMAMCAPWAHQVRWVKTGSEATHAAYRIAKAATNRTGVLVGDWAYHGWFEWSHYEDPSCLVSTASSSRRYGHGSVFDDLADCWDGDDVAVVFYEPHRWMRPPDGWLHAVREWCSKNGSLLVFDEMVYGLRWAKGGAAEYYGVTPDLACFGKALGNGVPVACVCGPSHLMQHATTFVSGTYGGDTLGLAAAGAVLREYRRRDVIGELWANGCALWDQFHAVCGLDLEGTAVHWRLPLSGDVLDRALVSAARSGLLVHRAANNASAAAEVSIWAHAGRVLGQAVRESLDHGPGGASGHVS